MTAPKITEADFIRLFQELGPGKLAGKLGTPMSGVMRRRRNIEQKHGIVLTSPQHNATGAAFQAQEIPGRLHLAVHNGTVIVGSDLHAFPGPAPTAFRAFVKFIKELEPKAVILNGDIIDGNSISRHPPLPNWEKRPTLIEEIEAAQERLHEIELAAPRRTELLLPLGNHDARFSVRLATVAPEYAQVRGTKLSDHFGERWKHCWSVWINDGECIVKHRPRSGGVHASYNSTLHGGATVCHGHLHSLKVTPFTDYRGRRYGVDCGCLADIYGPQFTYLEDGSRNWSSGFAVLSFKDGELLQPELCVVRDKDTVEWRGERRRV